MSSAFKVQKLTQTNKQSKISQQASIKDSPSEIILQITEIPILKYNSHSLIEILSSFFDNSQSLPSYHQVQKALQIVSLTPNDDILLSDIQSLIMKNSHRKKDFYVFFCIWSQYIPISAIIEKFSNLKTKQKIIYTLIFVYISEFSSGINWYQKLALKDQIDQLLKGNFLSKSKIIEQIDAQISYLKPSNLKHFQSIVFKIIQMTSMCQSPKISTQLQKILFNFIKNVKNSQFLDQIAQNLISKPQHKKYGVIESLTHYFSQNNMKDASQIIKNFINKGLSVKFNSENNQTFFGFIESVFKKSTKQAGQNFLKIAIKNWFVALNQNLLWNFFNINFTFGLSGSQDVKKNQIIRKRCLLFDIFSELSRQNEKLQKNVQRIIFSQYIFHFLEGRFFDFRTESQFLQNRSQIKFENQRETLIKVLRQIKNEKFLNVMTFNKSSFPEIFDWPLDISIKEMNKKYSNFDPLKKLLNQINQYWDKLEAQMLKQNKKIELMFSVLRVKIDKTLIFVTISQLAEILKQFFQGKNFNPTQINLYQYRNQYQSVQDKQKINKNRSISINKEQQIHPIIMEAKIVKLLKKTFKKATIQEISKSLNFDKQKTHQAVKKLVNKGFLEENQDQTFSYQA